MKRVVLYSVCFFLSFFLRLFIIYVTPDSINNIDLQIYRDAGQLIVNGINPYNFNDNAALRNQLRTDEDNYNEYVCFNQQRWNEYSNGNLPLSTLFFGVVEYFFASPFSYRIIFAFFDSLLAVLILAFVLNKWQYQLPKNTLTAKIPATIQKYIPFFIGLSLCAVSPIILYWGTHWPEHKGMGLLLILSAVYFSDHKNRFISLLLSPLLLGCSVAFIGLGAFVAPVCLYHIYTTNKNFKSLLIYSAVAFIFCAVWLIPFLPELFTMMSKRSATGDPQHGSMWLIFFRYAPHQWMFLKSIFIVLFIVVNAIGFYKKKLDLYVLTASLIFLYTCIHLTTGSLDRMNIALLTLIILLGSARYFTITILLSFLYLIYGLYAYYYSIMFYPNQKNDGYFVLVFSMVYFVFLLIQTFHYKNLKNETKYSYTGI